MQSKAQCMFSWKQLHSLGTRGLAIWQLEWQTWSSKAFHWFFLVPLFNFVVHFISLKVNEIACLLLTHFADVTLNPFWFPTAEKHRYKHSCSPVSQTLDFQRLSRISESLLLSNAPRVFDTAQQAHLRSPAMGCVMTSHLWALQTSGNVHDHGLA